MNALRTAVAAGSVLAGLLAWSGAALAQAVTVGPNGETAAAAASLMLSPAEVERMRAGHRRAALLWHTASDFTDSVSRGAQDEFKRLGVAVIATTDAGFDAARQKSDVETVLAKKPDIILSLPIDPVSAAETFRRAKERGVKLVFLSNVPRGYRAGVDYVTIATDDLVGMGVAAADALAKATGAQGEVAWLYHDADYYVTNQRDRAFKRRLQEKYPGLKIVVERGIADPARAEEVTNALLARYPALAGIYVPWAEPAEGVLAALRAAGNRKTRLVTLDLSEPLALDMVNNGNVVALVTDQAYALGQTMATAAAYGVLGKKIPPFLIVPAVTVTKANVGAAWREALHRDAPQSVSAGAAK
ncbi:MAG: substrate-binding domain-containing protein [Betaproteobacteria bacterium]|nr:MAG: substrate-binding domain-containing protein [Betaproteobacteria bacterium]